MSAEIGSNHATAYFDSERIEITHHSFRGTLDEFRCHIEDTYRNNKLAKSYNHWIGCVEQYIDAMNKVPVQTS